MTYEQPGGWLDGKSAGFWRYIGEGRLTYIGALLDRPTLSDALSDYFRNLPEVLSPFREELPPSVELCRRDGVLNHRVFIVINHSATNTVHLTIKFAARNLIDGTVPPSIDLKPQAVAVLDTNFIYVTDI
jgi:beta-galactosidase